MGDVTGMGLFIMRINVDAAWGKARRKEKNEKSCGSPIGSSIEKLA